MYGLRSAAAGGRFLQALRRALPGGRRMAFFSHHLGVCEQWELVSGAPATPWETARLTFRSRRFPQISFAADVSRVGSAAPAATPRSLPPASTALACPDALPPSTSAPTARVADVVVGQWLQFVLREQGARRALDARAAGLAAEVDEAKGWAVARVGELSAQLDAEVTGLAAELADAERQADESAAAAAAAHAALDAAAAAFADRVRAAKGARLAEKAGRAWRNRPNRNRVRDVGKPGRSHS